MENVIHHLALDLAGPDVCPMIEVQRGDSARSLIISLTQGGRPYWIDEGLTAALYATKPDGNPLFNACTIEKNRIRYDFTPQTVNVAGTYDCEIWLVAGDKRELTTPRFTIAVDERMRTDDVIPESAPEYTAITEMVAAGTAMIEELREALAGLEGVEEILTQARAAAEAASNSEAAATGHAKTAADAAADALGSAGRAYTSEQNAVTAAGDAQVQAETAKGYMIRSEKAAKDAEDAAKRAEEAASGAGGGGIAEETDPTVADWAKKGQPEPYGPENKPPNQTAKQVGADPEGTAENAVKGHDSDRNAHGDMRQQLQKLADGITPHIGANGNWYIDNTDTGIKAQGPAYELTPADKAAITAAVIEGLPKYAGEVTYV